MDRRTIVGGLAWIAGGIVLGTPAGATAPESRARPPRDFRIVAEFGSGEGNWKSWKTTIGADGRAVQADLSRRPPATKSSRLPGEAVRELFAAVRAARFFEIPHNYEVKSTDLPTLLVTVTADGRTHTVRVYGLEELKADPALSRFLDVWRAVLRRAPSPNPGQQPAAYLPHRDGT